MQGRWAVMFADDAAVERWWSGHLVWGAILVVARLLQLGLDCGPGPDRQRVALAAGHEVAREAPALAVLATRHVRHKMISAGAGNSSTRTGWTVFWVNRGVVVLQAAHVRSVC